MYISHVAIRALWLSSTYFSQYYN